MSSWNKLSRNFGDAGTCDLRSSFKVQKSGTKVRPEIMVPLVGFKKELDNQVAVIHEAAAAVQKETGQKSRISWHDD